MAARKDYAERRLAQEALLQGGPAGTYGKLRAKEETKGPQHQGPRGQFKMPNQVMGDMEINRRGETRFIFVNDIHVPDNIPLDPLFQFYEDFKPHKNILGGDIMEMQWASHWERGNRRKARSMMLAKEEYGLCNEKFFRPMRKASGDSDTIYLLGNHEKWADMAIDDNPDDQGYHEVWNNVEGIDHWCPNKAHVTLGKLTFLHGDILAGNSKTCADRMLNLYRRSVRFGHFHSYNESSFTSPVDITDRHTARCCGTLKNFDSGFMKHRPHAWIHGFTYGWINPDGTFDDFFVRINNGKFRAEGKIYK